jgi:hypothetical protein
MKNRTFRLHKILATTIVMMGSLWLATPAADAQTASTATSGWGTYYRLFAANSPWNSRPVKPVLGTNQVRKPLFNPSWVPSITNGNYSTAVFKATSSDQPMTVYGTTSAGVGDPDTGKFRNVTLPRWPANVVPAPGSDGHADIVDSVTGIMHSFFKLKMVNGKWTATMYAWTRIDGSGWGDAMHWSQGARASGVAPAAGLIRAHEINDNTPNYTHALAVSLPHHTLSNGILRPAYVHPATTTDSDAIINTGLIPMGSRLMLPDSFDANAMSTPQLRKIAATLKLFGAYVVDRNYDTAFTLYVESGTNFNIMPNGAWSNAVVADLEKIRAGLREVVGAQRWVDGNGANLGGINRGNLLSMRGAWVNPGTTVAGPGAFDTWQQAVVFPYTTKKLSQINYSTGLSKVSWAQVTPGTRLRFTAETTGGASVRLQVRINNVVEFDTGYLLNGVSSAFTWPKNATGANVVVQSESGTYRASSARGVLTLN